MAESDYPSCSGKLVILLGKDRHTENRAEYLSNHCPQICSLTGITEYKAHYVVDNQVPGLTAKSNGEDPYGIMAVDAIKGLSWEEVKHLYVSFAVIGVYEVTEHLVRGLYTDRPCGVKSPELKRIAMLAKPEGKTHQEAMTYWLNHHPAFCLEHHTGMASYTQNHVDRIHTKNAPRIDGFAALTYWNEDAFRYGHFSRPDSCEKMIEDCRNFRSTSFVIPVDEYIMKSPASWRRA